jgi:two-component system nitrogen regulation sensor histidine kinase NtrY
MASTVPAKSFMKEARAHYRMRGGKWVGITVALLLALVLALVLKADTALLGEVSPKRTVTLVLVTLLLMLMLMVYAVQHRARRLWSRAHDGVLGTRLQTRIILMFTAIAILPTVIVASFSILFFNVGIKSWFDHEVSGVLEDSVVVATAYVEEHKEAIRGAAISLGEAIQSRGASFAGDRAAFGEFLSIRSAERNLSEAVVFDRTGVLARSVLSFSLAFERLPEEVLSRADGGQTVIFGDDENKIQAVTKIAHDPDLYLLVARVVEPKVLDHMASARKTVDEYHLLQGDLAALQQHFFIIFILIAFIILLASVWAGILLAIRLIEPLRALMAATEHVRGGDFSIRVPEGRMDDEIANLGRTFNRMTGQLESQRRDLMDANRLADERRRFTEAVLLGVSAGVIALEEDGRISLHNRRALELLGIERIEIGAMIDAVLAVRPLMLEVQKAPSKTASADLAIPHGDKRVMLHVQVTAERFNNTIEGYIVTFDDITALVAAQRSAAWADVARRIAHEIKNPLTPISLSTERLRKKFRPFVPPEEQEAYEKYIDTISRHVRDIGRMVEEFVAYARMPSSVFREENLVMLVRKAVFSEQTTHPDIEYVQDLPRQEILIHCDESQLGRALLNLLKNAAEAMEGSATKQIRIKLERTESGTTRAAGAPLPAGEVGFPSDAKQRSGNPGEGARVILTLEDTGPGFPPDKLDTLTEPYVTTRAKGTGLGLAIVKRSIEEHKGTLTLTNREGGGARVVITLPV